MGIRGSAQAIADRLVYTMHYIFEDREIFVYRDPENNNALVSDVAKYAIELAQLSDPELQSEDFGQHVTWSAAYDSLSDAYSGRPPARSRFIRHTIQRARNFR